MTGKPWIPGVATIPDEEREAIDLDLAVYSAMWDWTENMKVGDNFQSFTQAFVCACGMECATRNALMCHLRDLTDEQRKDHLMVHLLTGDSLCRSKVTAVIAGSAGEPWPQSIETRLLGKDVSDATSALADKHERLG